MQIADPENYIRNLQARSVNQFQHVDLMQNSIDDVMLLTPHCDEF
jgi:hypothetical protein